jgi:hypothetical protein
MLKTLRAVALAGLMTFMLPACDKKMDCGQSIEAYCADPTIQWKCTWNEPCPSDFGWCDYIYRGACGTFNRMNLNIGMGMWTDWYYDRITGGLVAVVGCGLAPDGAKEPVECRCIAGPSGGWEDCWSF